MKSGHFIQVKETDTIESLAKEFNLTKDNISEFNQGKSIKPGDWVYIPLKRGLLSQDTGTHAFDPNLYLKSGEFLWPVPSSSTISSGFGGRWGRPHAGIDIPAKVGAHIVAAAEGVVVYSGSDIGGYSYNSINDKYHIKIIADKSHIKSTHISMNDFLSETFDFYKYKSYSFKINDINTNTNVGLIDIYIYQIIDTTDNTIIKNSIYISYINRYSNLHKGAIKDVLYLIICKGIEVNANINFEAVPGNTRNREKLYAYYNKIGFKRRPNTTLKKSWVEYFIEPDYIRYNTHVNNLKKIVNKINNNTNNNTRCIGRFCGTRKRSKQPPPA
jgi:hypothetical protein